MRKKYATREEYKKAQYALARKRYRENPEVRAACYRQTKKWRENHKDNWAELARGYRLRHDFGITLEQYSLILSSQKGVCALCKRPPKEKRKLAVDHDHQTKEVRGLLCDGCNRSLGFIETRIGSLLPLFFYLSKRHVVPKAA